MGSLYGIDVVFLSEVEPLEMGVASLLEAGVATPEMGVTALLETFLNVETFRNVETFCNVGLAEVVVADTSIFVGWGIARVALLARDVAASEVAEAGITEFLVEAVVLATSETFLGVGCAALLESVSKMSSSPVGMTSELVLTCTMPAFDVVSSVDATLDAETIKK